MRILWSIIVSGVMLAAVLLPADARRQAPTEPRVSLDLTDRGVAEAVQALFQAANRRYRLEAAPTPGSVTVTIRDLPLSVALRIILRQAKLPPTFPCDGDTDRI